MAAAKPVGQADKPREPDKVYVPPKDHVTPVAQLNLEDRPKNEPYPSMSGGTREDH